MENLEREIRKEEAISEILDNVRFLRKFEKMLPYEDGSQVAFSIALFFIEKSLEKL